MEVDYTDDAKMHLLYWKKTGNISIQKKIQNLIFSIENNYYHGIGKPEALKYSLTGLWSRRVNKEHRLIYEIDTENNRIIIHSLKGHY